MSTAIAKRHARTRRGCLTCRIRKKKCDSSRPSCTKCDRLHVQCLGYASDRPDWLKGTNAKGYTQAIKCFLSEYPAAKAYDDPVPYLVLKSTPEVEQTLARDPNRFSPVCFDPENATLKQWLPPLPPPPSGPPENIFVSAGEPSYGQNYPALGTDLPSPYAPATPSPRTPYTFPGQYPYGLEAGQESWAFTPNAEQDFQPGPYVATQPTYGHSIPQGIPTPNYYDPLDGQAVHYIAGPNRALTRTRRARQDLMRPGRQ